jgi:hypothetical protein
MPKNEIDYSNTIIYKITCKDSMVSDLYVGHTTNFVQRKHAHKQSCINTKSPNHKCKLYEVIRNNGGWVNWKMEIINFFNCINHYEARKKEQEYFVSLNATLNSIEPYAIHKPTEVIAKNKIIKEVLNCNECNKYFSNKNLLETHNKTNKHIKNLVKSSLTKNTNIDQMLTKTQQISPKIFDCENCKYKCSKKSDFDKHLSTRKHEKLMNVNNKLIEKSPYYNCSQCNKEYKSNVGLWKHKKKCNIDENIKLSELTLLEKISNKNNEKIDLLINENIDFKNIILELVKSNTELQKQMIDVCKNSNTTINNNNNNSKTFNMQVFLNEQCKDAMNIMDFVNSMTLEFSDLENVGKNGYVEGISSIIIKKLNELDIYKRPIHCSDAKREIMFVKDDNVWEKENSTYDKLRKAIKYVTKKNSDMLIPWSKKYPACMNTSHPLNDTYIKLMGQAMGGKEDFVDSENKIMKKIAKAVLINKTC